MLATMVLVGRFSGIKSLVTIVPDGSPMAFPSVMGFALAGVAFVAHGTRHTGWARMATVTLLLARGASPATRAALYGETARDWARHGASHAPGAQDRCLESARLIEGAAAG